MSQPNFYAIIPATVRYCKDLEPHAKLLYGEITALCSKEGFCWATNKYFGDLYDVDNRTVQRWLESLKNQNFISIEIEAKGIKRERKIWIIEGVQNNFTKRQNCHPPHDKNVVCINTVSTTSKETPPNPLKGERVSYGSHVKLNQEEYEASKILLGSEDALKGMIEDINDHIDSTGRKPYKDYAATIRNWVKRRGNSKAPKAATSKFQQNIEFTKKIVQIFPDQVKKEEIVEKENGLVFTYGNIYKLFEFTDFDFILKVENRLKSMGLYVGRV